MTPLINEMPNPTPGESKFVRLISNIDEENPQFEFRLYFEPQGRHKFPDFVLYSASHGIVFFEVKDISIGAVQSFDHYGTTFDRKGKLDKLEFGRPQIVFDYIEEFNLSNSSIPVSVFYVFPNISIVELEQKFQFDALHLENPLILRDDFVDYDTFIEKLKVHRKFIYKETDLSRERALDRITRKLSPVVIEKKENGTLETGLFKDLNPSNDIFVLSKHQEHTLRTFMNHQGFRFLKGHAGTGKTVLIISRAEFLAQTFKKAKILITYYTSQLDGVFHHLMNKYPDQIMAQRMGQFCNAHILEIEEKTKWEEYYRECGEIIANKEHPFHTQYDFILIDEGQDFIPELGIIIEHLAKGGDYKEKNVLIAYDDLQALNLKGKVDTTETFRGKQRGRVKRLKDSFRTPREIAERASKLINEEIHSVRSVENAFNYKKLQNRSELMPYIEKVINKARENDGYAVELKDIAIIYPHHSHLHSKVNEDLKSFSKPIQTYNRKTSKAVIMENNTVKVLSSTYCKGLDFRIVFLIYFDELSEEGHETINKKAKEHLYVSMTRTRDYLFVLSVKDNPLIDLIIT